MESGDGGLGFLAYIYIEGLGHEGIWATPTSQNKDLISMT